MNRRDFIKKGIQGAAFLSTPNLVRAAPSLESELFSKPTITNPIVKRNTEHLHEQLQFHHTNKNEMLEYLYEHLDAQPATENESDQSFTFYDREYIKDLHPRQISKAYLFLKSLQDPTVQKNIHLHLVVDLFDKRTEFGGRVTSENGTMLLEYLRNPSVDEYPDERNNYSYSPPVGLLDKPHHAIYHCHAADFKDGKGILSGPRKDTWSSDVEWTIGSYEKLGEDHQLMFNLQKEKFDVIYYGMFEKDVWPELFHLRLGEYFVD